MKPKFFGFYKTIKAGARGQVVHLPTAFSRLNDLKPGMDVAVYMVEDDTRVLMIKAATKKKSSKTP